MAKIDENGSIDYSLWQNSNALRYAQQADNDKVKGLNRTIEVFNLVKFAIDEKVDKSDLNELFGLSLSSAARAKTRGFSGREKSPQFQKAIENYNKILAKIKELQPYKYSNFDISDEIDRLEKMLKNVTAAAYTNIEAKLGTMEQNINEAFENCDAYKEILIVPQWYFRFYPYLNSHLDSFDIEEIRTKTSKSMVSLQILKQDIENAIEQSGGDPKVVNETEYDADAIAKKHLGMSYEKFAKENEGIIEKCKTMTYAGKATLSPAEADAYKKLQAYAQDMLETTINEAHTVRWDTGERKVDEMIKATSDMYAISNFEAEGITDEGLAAMESGISYRAFAEAMESKLDELVATGIKSLKTNKKSGVRKVIDKNGNLKIETQDKDFDFNGKRVR